jgi:quercetin dioxygenase-like cupin family protein
MHLADRPGFVRGRCNDMEGTAFSAGLVLVPPGQRSPLHSESGEHIIYALEGEVEFAIEGEPYPLEPGDLLFVPAHARYLYANVGRSTATLLAIFGRVDEWPPRGTYYE